MTSLGRFIYISIFLVPWPMASGLQTGGHGNVRQEMRKLKINQKRETKTKPKTNSQI